MAKTDPLRPCTVHLETANYTMRTLEPHDNVERLAHWLEDPVAAANLNAAPATRTIEETRAYVASFDRVHSHLIGIFEKASGRLVGIRAFYVDHAHKEFEVNTLIGETDARFKGARSETRDAAFRFFFENLGMESGRCSALSTNAPILKALYAKGWVLEHREPKRAASGNGFVELQFFRLTRAVFHAHEARDAA